MVLALQTENLCKAFGRGKKRVEAVKNLALTVEPGQVFGFLGPNGAGKSTTIRMLMDLIRPTQGRALVYGQVTVFFQAIRHGLADIAYEPAFSMQALSDFLQLYLREAGFGITSLFLMTGFAAIAAILTRSVLGSLLISLGLSVLELVSGLLLAFTGHFISWPELVNAYQLTPSYSIENIRSWLVNEIAFAAPLPEFTAEPVLLFSVIVLVIWLLGSAGLAIWLFQRQDITE